MIDDTNRHLKTEEGKNEKYKNLLKIELNFHREANIQLDLEEKDEDVKDDDS